MLLDEFLAGLSAVEIDADIVTRIEKVYGRIDSVGVKEMVSCEDDITVGSWRLLSTAMIESFDDIACVNTASLHLLPIFDALDNDYVVYKLQTGAWAMYNIADELEFNEADSLEELAK